MNRILAGFRGYAADARAALTWAPVEVALGWLVAFSASWAIAVQDANVLETWTRLGIAVAIALPVVFGASILRASDSIRSSTRWSITAAALLVGALYGGLVFETVISEAWRSWLLFGASLALLTLTPLLMRDRPVHAAQPPWNALAGERARFWIFFQRVAMRAITVYGMALLLAIGISIAVASVDTLFDLSAADEETYFHIFSWIVIGVGTWAMAGGAPDLAAAVEVDRDAALVRARRIGLYLLLPLLIVYTGILYAYMVRIAFLAEVPQNLVSPLVLAAGAMWLAGAIALEPFHWLEEPPIAARIIRFFPWLAVPLVGLGMWALWLRVDQYGWTEFRHVRMVALAGLLALAITGILRRLKGRPPILKEIPITMVALLVFAATGPWGAVGTALRSQTDRLPDLVARAEAEEVGDAMRLVVTDAEQEVAEVVRYLRDHFGMETPEALVPAPLLARLDSLNLLWGGPRRPTDGAPPTQVYANANLADGIPNIPGGTLYRFAAFDRRPAAPRGDDLQAYLEGLRIRVVRGGGVYVADLAPRVDAPPFRDVESDGDDVGGRLPTRTSNVNLVGDQAVVPLVDASGEEAGVLVLESLALEAPAGETLSAGRIISASGVVVLTAGSQAGAGTADGAPAPRPAGAPSDGP
jgi:hypothetical protein